MSMSLSVVCLLMWCVLSNWVFCVGVGVYLLVDNVNVFERHKND
jgi:hypothetical protein